MNDSQSKQDAGPSWCWFAAVLLVGLCAAWPLAWQGYPWNTDDVQWHAIWAQQFLVEMQEGTAYPRWLHGMNAGQGSPTFFFYAPLSFFATSLASIATGSVGPFASLAIVTTAALCGSGAVAFVWLRSLVAPAAAAVGAALYIVLPYHLTVDVWTRSAFAEANAYAWTPLLFLGIEQVRAGRRTGLPVLALGFALLSGTHIITAMLAGLIAGLYAVIRSRSVTSLAAMAGAVLLGIGLSAAYLATATGLKDLTEHSVRALEPGLFFPMQPGLLGRPQLIRLLTLLGMIETAALVTFAAAGMLLVHGKLRGLWLAWAALTAIVLASMTRPMEPIWNAVSILQNVQFPSRMLALADLGLATAAGLVAAVVLPRVPMRQGATVLVLMLLAALGAGQAYFPLRSGAFDHQAANWQAEWAVQGDHGFLRPLESQGRLPQDRRPPESTTDPLAYLSGSPMGLATVVDAHTRHYEVDVETSTPAMLRLRQLHFVGWQASTDGQVLPVTAGPTGLIEVAVPPGRHRVTIVLAATPIERAGMLASVASALVWSGLVWWALRRRRLAPAAAVA